MGRPQRTYLVLLFLTGCAYGYKHGEPKNENYNLGTRMFNAGIVLFLLYMGGFFN